MTHNKEKDLALSLLKTLTVSGRVVRRKRKLLRPPTGEPPREWFMCVPAVFNGALDIKFEKIGPNKGWSQAGCFAFKEADTIYDAKDAYGLWSEALKKISIVVTVTRAFAAGQGQDNKRFSGRVEFAVFMPDKKDERLESVLKWELTQDDFVHFLIAGPTGDFAERMSDLRRSLDK